MKKALVAVVTFFLEPAFRPFEVKLARTVGLAVLGYLGVKYGAPAVGA